MAKSVFKYDPEDYTTVGLRYGSISEREKRAEYARLRKIFNKRIERFAKSEFVTSDFYKKYKKGFKMTRDIKSEKELNRRLAELAFALERKEGSVSGMRRSRNKRLTSLRERGYDFVTEENFKNFTEFMEESRARKLSRLYDSKSIAEVFQIVDSRISKKSRDEVFEEFKFFMENAEKIKKYPSGKKRHNAKEWRAILKDGLEGDTMG